MKNDILILLCFMFLGSHVTAQPVAAQRSLLTAVNKYIGRQEILQKASESPKARKIIKADLDGDGDEDAVVQYILEGFDGGNNFAQMLAVFRNDKGSYKFVTEDAVGGKFLDRTFTLEKVVKRKIYVSTQSCPEVPQGICENPKRGQAIFVFRKGKLQELKTKDFNDSTKTNLQDLKIWIGKYPINKGSKKFADFFEIPQVRNLLTDTLGAEGFQNLLKHFAGADLIKEKKGFLEVFGTSARKANQNVDYGMIAINLQTGETHIFFVDDEKLSGFSNVKGNGSLPLAVKADILPFTGQSELIGTTTQKSSDGCGCYAVIYSIRNTPQDTKPSIFYLTDEGGVRADDGVMNIEGKDVLLKVKSQTERKGENGKIYVDWVYENKDVRAHFEMGISEIPDSSAVVYEGTVIASTYTKMQSVPIKVFCGG
ncbi:MAG: hypothetical protein ACR2LT_07775 [Pyrinomonadaceae bacterium]